ncbi:hypothetical protein HBI64_209380 [Parastagonospora nodorum]|nr:hypothetical protein HBH47_212890 [Parastagonospora nodorum]KAH6113452.1 hypothetical protein HBI64_209380 [Parastagonospora nodorum]KAH6319087.1 hypothetical protein HBI39_010120 [Parastagonospora nodorum]
MGSIDMTGIDPLTPEKGYHSKPDLLRVVCVGAGAAGLLVAHRMQTRMTNFELVLYEKNEDVGGTWPAHNYTYPFEQNPDWSSFYAYAPEILAYFRHFAESKDVRKYVKFNSKVTKAIWDENKGEYGVEIHQGQEVIHDSCHVLINGTGFLNSWKWPKIDGLHDFGGKLVHSANWDPTIDWADKRVAVIGTGSSAIQIVPQIQKSAKHLTAFMRSVTWISPPVATDILAATKVTSHDAAERNRLDAQYCYTAEEKERYRRDPESLLELRRKIEIGFNNTFDFFVMGSEAQKITRTYMEAEMKRRIGPGHEDLKEKLIPKWSPGCRRITPGDGYLESLVQPNVTTVHEEISRVVSEGLIDDSGTLHEVDILVCATGFNMAFAPSFTITGTDGVNMRDEFDPDPNVYLALAVPKFPNYFVINGVRGSWAAGSILPAIDAQTNYILRVLQRVQSEKIRSFEVKNEPTRQLNEHIDAWHKHSVWNDDCKSWYKNNIPGGKLWIWGGSSLHYLKTIDVVRWEHFDFRYKSANMWSFLGNGYTKAQAFKDENLLAPYIRTEDTPWSVE